MNKLNYYSLAAIIIIAILVIRSIADIGEISEPIESTWALPLTALLFPSLFFYLGRESIIQNRKDGNPY